MLLNGTSEPSLVRWAGVTQTFENWKEQPVLLVQIFDGVENVSPLCLYIKSVFEVLFQTRRIKMKDPFKQELVMPSIVSIPPQLAFDVSEDFIPKSRCTGLNVMKGMIN